METFSVPMRRLCIELEIKRSRFVTSVDRTIGRANAQLFIENVRAQYPEASHNCWAYVAGMPDDVYQIDKSDDGEPRNTAGRPMLNVLQHSGLAQTCVVVSRYFGGIKLGAGGLVRAYTKSVSEAIKQLKTETHFLMTNVHVELPYSLWDQVQHNLDKTAVIIESCQYNESVVLHLRVPINQLDAISAMLLSLGHGKIIVRHATSCDLTLK